MIELRLSMDQLDRAGQLNPVDGPLNRHSFTGGSGALAGYVGEVALYDWLVAGGHDVEHANTYDYDILVDGIRFEVKTKRTSKRPMPHHIASVPAYNTEQDCDYYVFMRVNMDDMRAWICGYASRRMFYRMATYTPEGYVDRNGWVCPEPCYRVEYSSLYNFKGIR